MAGGGEFLLYYSVFYFCQGSGNILIENSSTCCAEEGKEGRWTNFFLGGGKIVIYFFRGKSSYAICPLSSLPLKKGIPRDDRDLGFGKCRHAENPAQIERQTSFPRPSNITREGKKTTPLLLHLYKYYCANLNYSGKTVL